MAYDLQEQESIDQMKAWWDTWGTPVTAAVCIVCLGFAGWNGWNWYQRNETAKAGAAFVQLQNAVYTNDAKNVASISQGLIDHYGSTIYGPLSAFAAAQASLAEGKFDAAAEKLMWVIEKSGRPEYEAVARIRLAGVYFDAGKLDDALAQLDAVKVEGAQKAQVLDRRGDVLRAKGDAAGARVAYEDALKLLDAASQPSMRRLVELKLGSLPRV